MLWPGNGLRAAVAKQYSPVRLEFVPFRVAAKIVVILDD